MAKKLHFRPPVVAIIIAFIGLVLFAIMPRLTFFEVWGINVVGLAIAGVMLFAGVWYLLELMVYKRLRVLNQKLHLLLNRRNIESKKPTATIDDPVSGISNAMLELSNDFRREFQQMHELDLFRKAYIGDVSHELKTPIFAIEGYLETLLDGALEDKNVNKKFIKQALKNVQRLNDLVADLLTITQLEAGQLEMKIEAFRFHDLLLDVIESVEYKLTNKGRNIKVNVQAPNGGDTAIVYADRERIRQVLLNLLTNAIKYGKADGTITMTIQPQNDRLMFSITDEGKGIPQEHLPHIFDRFYRVEKSRSRENGGTGLGLSIVKNLLDAHKAPYDVKSQEGVGTTFTFSLSRIKPEPRVH